MMMMTTMILIEKYKCLIMIIKCFCNLPSRIFKVCPTALFKLLLALEKDCFDVLEVTSLAQEHGHLRNLVSITALHSTRTLSLLILSRLAFHLFVSYLTCFCFHSVIGVSGLLLWKRRRRFFDFGTDQFLRHRRSLRAGISESAANACKLLNSIAIETIIEQV